MKKKKFNLGNFIWIVFLFFFVWRLGSRAAINHFGEEVSGAVQSVYKSGSKGHIACRYVFTVDSKRYSESCRCRGYRLGDTLTIIYLPFYPSYSHIKNNTRILSE